MPGRDVSMVLNLQTGLVSLQFHVELYPTFQTLREEEVEMLPSLWEQNHSFVAHAIVAKSNPQDPVTRTDKTTQHVHLQTMREIHQIKTPSTFRGGLMGHNNIDDFHELTSCKRMYATVQHFLI